MKTNETKYPVIKGMSEEEKIVMDNVIDEASKKSGLELSEISKEQKPYKDASDCSHGQARGVLIIKRSL